MARSIPDIAKVRQARDDGRLSEDDIAKSRLGPLGIPGQPDKPKGDDDRLQIPKHPDPGHTA
jgi:hypothetical protein